MARVKELEKALKKAIGLAESFIKDSYEGTSSYTTMMKEIKSLKKVLDKE